MMADLLPHRDIQTKPYKSTADGHELFSDFAGSLSEVNKPTPRYQSPFSKPKSRLLRPAARRAVALTSRKMLLALANSLCRVSTFIFFTSAAGNASIPSIPNEIAKSLETEVDVNRLKPNLSNTAAERGSVGSMGASANPAVLRQVARIGVFQPRKPKFVLNRPPYPSAKPNSRFAGF